jgi:hypothetical protein
LKKCSAPISGHLLHLGPIGASAEADEVENDANVADSKRIPVRKLKFAVTHYPHVCGIGKSIHATLYGLPARECGQT